MLYGHVHCDRAHEGGEVRSAYFRRWNRELPHMMPRCRSLYTRALAREDATMGTISWIIEHKHVAIHVYIYAAIRHALSGNACSFNAAGFMKPQKVSTPKRMQRMLTM